MLILLIFIIIVCLAVLIFGLFGGDMRGLFSGLYSGGGPIADSVKADITTINEHIKKYNIATGQKIRIGLGRSIIKRLNDNIPKNINTLLAKHAKLPIVSPSGDYNELSDIITHMDTIPDILAKYPVDLTPHIGNYINAVKTLHETKIKIDDSATTGLLMVQPKKAARLATSKTITDIITKKSDIIKMVEDWVKLSQHIPDNSIKERARVEIDKKLGEIYGLNNSFVVISELLLHYDKISTTITYNTTATTINNIITDEINQIQTFASNIDTIATDIDKILVDALKETAKRYDVLADDVITTLQEHDRRTTDWYSELPSTVMHKHIADIKNEEKNANDQKVIIEGIIKNLSTINSDYPNTLFDQLKKGVDDSYHAYSSMQKIQKVADGIYQNARDISENYEMMIDIKTIKAKEEAKYKTSATSISESKDNVKQIDNLIASITPNEESLRQELVDRRTIIKNADDAIERANRDIDLRQLDAPITNIGIAETAIGLEARKTPINSIAVNTQYTIVETNHKELTRLIEKFTRAHTVIATEIPKSRKALGDAIYALNEFRGVLSEIELRERKSAEEREVEENKRRQAKQAEDQKRQRAVAELNQELEAVEIMADPFTQQFKKMSNLGNENIDKWTTGIIAMNLSKRADPEVAALLTSADTESQHKGIAAFLATLGIRVAPERLYIDSHLWVPRLRKVYPNFIQQSDFSDLPARYAARTGAYQRYFAN